MSVDDELDRIRLRRKREMLRVGARKEEEPGVATHNRPLDLNDDSFTPFIQGNTRAVVDCWAPWCGPCRLISPIIEGMARDYSGRISFGKLNVDENPRTALQYGIMSIPTLLVFKDGAPVDRIVGAMPRRDIEMRVSQLLL